MASDLPRRYAAGLLVVFAALSARAARQRRPPPPRHSHRSAGAAAGIRGHRLRCAAASTRRDRLCRSPGADVQRPGFRFCAAAATTGVFPAATAAGFRRVGAAAAADRTVYPAAAVLRADPGLCPCAGLCRAAAEQHHFRQHPQHHRHQQRHQPAGSASAVRPGNSPRCPRGSQRPTQRGCSAGVASRAWSGGARRRDAGRRWSRAAGGGPAKGLADPARKTADAAERPNQSRSQARHTRRADRSKGWTSYAGAHERISQCAAAWPGAAKAQCAPGPGHQRGASRAPGRDGIRSKRAESQCETCTGDAAAGRGGSESAGSCG
jgi:hypothetical protein